MSMQCRKELKSITQKGGKCHLQTKANDVRISNRADDFSYDDLLKNQWKYNRERLDEIVEIMVELHTTPEAAIRISGREWPAWAIQDRLKKLTYDSLMTVYYNLDRTKNDIRNIKNYLIATLMNTPITQESQFTAEYRAHPV